MEGADGGVVAEAKRTDAYTPKRLPHSSEYSTPMLSTPPEHLTASEHYSSQYDEGESQDAQEQISPVDLKGGTGYTFHLKVGTATAFLLPPPASFYCKRSLPFTSLPTAIRLLFQAQNLAGVKLPSKITLFEKLGTGSFGTGW